MRLFVYLFSMILQLIEVLTIPVVNVDELIKTVTSPVETLYISRSPVTPLVYWISSPLIIQK